MWNTGPLLWVLVIAAAVGSSPAPPPSCPEACRCTTTSEGLHKAVCSSLSALLNYSLLNRRHNINILDLSHAGISGVNGELDKFTEIVSIDLSSNKISRLSKLPSGSKKLVHLNLAKNRLKRFSASLLPTSVSSLDLSHNMLHDVPTDLNLLNDLEHLILKGNPLHCTCDNLKELLHLKSKGVVIDDAKCIAPMNTKGAIWNEVKISEMCSEKKDFIENKNGNHLEDMMMGDQPFDTENFAENTEPKKLLPLTDRDLDAGEIWEGSGGEENDDEKVFLGVSHDSTTEQPGMFEGSGDIESINTNRLSKLSEPLMLDTNESTTEEPGSGDFGSGLIRARYFNDPLEEYDEGSGDNDTLIDFSSTTEPFITSAIFNPFFLSGMEINSSTSEEPIELPERPSVFQGTVDWDSEPTEKPSSTDGAIVEEVFVRDPDNTNLESNPDLISDKGKISMDEETQESKPPVRSALGTYICVGILISLVVLLIGITVVRNQRRKKRDRRLLRQEKKDIEKPGKEMVDMNKSLLGKPVIPNEAEKKSNGNYELVPTHEPRKNDTNGTLDSRKEVNENHQKSEAPEQMAQSPNTVKQNGSNNDSKPIPAAEESRPLGNKSVSPTPDSPQSNGRSYPDSHLLPPLNTFPESILLPPPSEYIPVYDSGRVRIKLTETPKPKTPVLITRSRSNAGDIIITPSPEPISPTKSTT